MTTTKKLLLLLALALAGCRAQNRSSIVILGRAAPSSPTECKYAAGGEFQMGPGVLDVGAAYSGFLRYELPLYVNNELSDPAATSDTAVSAAKTWRPDVAKVRVNPPNWVKDNNPSPALLPFSAENAIPLDGQTIPVNGKSVLLVSAVSQELGLAIQQVAPVGQLSRVVLGISVQGHTMDGEFLESGEWYYSVDVCVGCLQCVGCTTTGTLPICPAGQVAASSCGGPGQDSATACVAPTP